MSDDEQRQRLDERSRKLARIVEAALERGAQRPVALDISLLTSFADAFVLLSGRSDRQVRAIAESVIEALDGSGEAPLGVEGLEEGRWVLIDCNDVVVHVFDPEARHLYALERLWSDAPVIDLAALGLDPAALAAAGAGGTEGEDDERGRAQRAEERRR